jgi:YesN/AraC family two-component response regulator
VEALAFLAENRDFDMVVSDINMPGMDGLTLLAKLHDEATRFSTVIVSAYGDMANIRTAMNRARSTSSPSPSTSPTSRPPSEDDRARC